MKNLAATRRSGAVRKLSLIFGLFLTCNFLGLQLLAQNRENGGADLPQPTGLYGVGRVSYYWIDNSRAETMSSDPKARRELMVHIYYPIDPRAKGSSAPYFPDVELMRDYEEKHFGHDFMRQEYGEAYTNLFTARTHTVAGASLSGAKKKYPLLVFQPGLGTKVFLYTSLLEDLASHGFVVAAVEPTYETSVVIFPGGRAVEESDKWNSYFSGPPEQSALFHLARIEVNAADDSFVLNQLIKLNAGAIKGRRPDFRGRLEPLQAGVFGHSQGGLAARRSCQIDPRWTACINLGGGLREKELEEMAGDAILRPFMLMTPVMKNRKLVEQDDALFRNMKAIGYKLSVDAPGFGHFIYYDFELPDAKMEASRSGLSSSQRLRDTQIIRAFILAFFEKYSSGWQVLSLEALSKYYPEVNLEKFGTDKQ